MSGSGGTQTSTSTTQNGAQGYLQPLLAGAANEASNLYNAPGPSYFPGQTLAGPGAATTQALNSTIARADNGNPLLPQAQAELGKTIGGQYLDPSNNKYLASAANYATQPMRDTFQNSVLPGIQSTFSQAGRYGSGALGNTLNQANDQLERNVGGVSSGMYANAYQQERANQLAATNAAPGLANADYTDLSAKLAAGQAQDQNSQAGINDQVQRWNYGQQLPYNKLSQLASILYGQNQPGNSTTTQTTPTTGNSMLSGIFGGSSALASLALAGGQNGLGLWGASDRRLKTEIRKVGKTDEGLNIYTYKYKGTSEPRMGVMAQDVAQVKPDAVAEIGNTGYLAVNYAKVA